MSMGSEEVLVSSIHSGSPTIGVWQISEMTMFEEFAGGITSHASKTGGGIDELLQVRMLSISMNVFEYGVTCKLAVQSLPLNSACIHESDVVLTYCCLIYLNIVPSST